MDHCNSFLVNKITEEAEAYDATFHYKNKIVRVK